MQQEVDWIPDKLTQLRGVEHVVLLAADGLPRGVSRGTDRSQAERLAAAASGLSSLAQSVAAEHGKSPEGKAVLVKQQAVDFHGGALFLMPAAEGSVLAVVTKPMPDPTIVIQEMARIVNQLGENSLRTPGRAEPPLP